MQEMRITPELATYKDIVHQIFLQLIDGGLNTPEEIKAFLEPHSPPAPPPQITIKRTRAKRERRRRSKRNRSTMRRRPKTEPTKKISTTSAAVTTKKSISV